MDLLGQNTYCFFPDEYAMLEDIHVYLSILALDISSLNLNDMNVTFEKSCYPVIEFGQEIILFINQAVPRLGEQFVFTLMLKHRLKFIF